MILQENAGIFVNGLRQATGKNTCTPNINSVTNCDTNWNTTPCPRVAIITVAAVNQADGVDKFTNDTASGAWSYYNLFQRHGFAPNANVDTHFDNRASRSGRLGRFLAALKNIGPTVSYGVDQNTALYLNGSVATVYGRGGVFVAEATAINFGTGSKFSANSATFKHMIDQTPAPIAGRTPLSRR